MTLHTQMATKLATIQVLRAMLAARACCRAQALLNELKGIIVKCGRQRVMMYVAGRELPG